MININESLIQGGNLLNILVLTSNYPQPDDNEKAGVTPVVHSFTKEWVKNSNNVIVIHSANKYPRILYLLPEKIIQKINAKVGMVIPGKCQRQKLSTVKDNVKVFRLPMFKFMPVHKFFDIQIKLQYKKIIKILSENNFNPDIVIGHWENPQVPLLSMLKQKYSCRTTLILHQIIYLKQKSCKKWVINHLKNIDVLGCRSKPIAIAAKELLKPNRDPFICYSGIPDEYIEKFSSQHPKEFSNGNITKFLFTGQLIERKHVDCIIKALHEVYSDRNFNLAIVGIGACEYELTELVKKLNLQKQVIFYGRITRDEVLKLMQDMECFTMISRDEAFGLVYLEAMAKGCIVIASRNEGIDGVIEDGINGFLCNAGDEKELANIYKRINNLTKDQKEQISKNAIESAKNFKDSDVAKRYLDTVINV